MSDDEKDKLIEISFCRAADRGTKAILNMGYQQLTPGVLAAGQNVIWWKDVHRSKLMSALGFQDLSDEERIRRLASHYMNGEAIIEIALCRAADVYTDAILVFADEAVTPGVMALSQNVIYSLDVPVQEVMKQLFGQQCTTEGELIEALALIGATHNSGERID